MLRHTLAAVDDDDDDARGGAPRCALAAAAVAATLVAGCVSTAVSLLDRGAEVAAATQRVPRIVEWSRRGIASNGSGGREGGRSHPLVETKRRRAVRAWYLSNAELRNHS